LREISSSLLVKGQGEDYIEAEEKVHVIEKKLKQLQEQVAQDLMSLQRSLVSQAPCQVARVPQKRQVGYLSAGRCEVVPVIFSTFVLDTSLHFLSGLFMSPS
jgi:isopentenyl phosphate kinase